MPETTEIIVPRIMLYVVDETEWWRTPEWLARCGGGIYGVYIFDERYAVHCCSVTPSYEMQYLDSVPKVTPKDEDEKEAVWDFLQREGFAELYTYWGVPDLARLLKDPLDGAWDGETCPCFVDVARPSVEEWLSFCDDEDTDDDTELRNRFMDATREHVTQNGAY